MVIGNIMTLLLIMMMEQWLFFKVNVIWANMSSFILVFQLSIPIDLIDEISNFKKSNLP